MDTKNPIPNSEFRIPNSLSRLALLHPFFAALTPIVFLGAVNIDQVTAKTLFIPLGVSAAVTAAVYAVLWYGRREADRAAAITTLAIVLFFSYGHVLEVICSAGWHLRRHMADWLLSTFCVLVFLPLAIWLWRTRLSLAKLTQFLLLTAAMLLLVSTQQIVREYRHYHRPRAARARPAKPAAALPAEPNATQALNVPTARPIDIPERVPPLEQDSPSHPDIYYIILDGYGREDMLGEVYGHDNSAFIAALRERGFYVADASCANYAMTFLSLASSLNMRYIHQDTEQLGRTGRRRGPIYGLIRDNTVGRYLQAKGYRYVHVASNWGGTERSHIADVTHSALHPFWQQEFIGVLIRTTWLHRFAPNVAHTHLYAFRKLEEVADMPGPTFTFAHLVLPHSPYVFDRDGNIQEEVPPALQFHDEGNTGGWKNKQGYLDQLLFTNRRALAVIDTILRRSPVPPVIIVQADHGTASRKQNDISPHKQPDLISERMPILNAYYVPQACQQRLYAEISPVNTFRLLFNALFQEDFEQLPDRHYFSWYARPYQFRDVTELVSGQQSVISGQ